MIVARFKRVLGFMNNPVLEESPLEARLTGVAFFFETDDGKEYRHFTPFLNGLGFSMAEWGPFAEKIRKRVHEALDVPLTSENDHFDEYLNCRDVPCVLVVPDEGLGIVTAFFSADSEKVNKPFNALSVFT